jgi:redox-sensitive bicupin YhaK (pirin superfamily)
MSTDPLFVDVTLEAGSEATLAVPEGHNAFVYVYEGSLDIAGRALQWRQAGILGAGSLVTLKATEPTRAILVAGKPINEPVVQYGPFVMNTREEIEQALADYRRGTLTA